jgi:hypothetical protein
MYVKKFQFIVVVKLTVVSEKMKNQVKEILFLGYTSFDALPSLGVNPLEGSPKCSYGKLGLERRSRLLAL